MSNVIHEITFDGALLARGFWLYVWEITTLDSRVLYYVGRTGDNSTVNAQSPFNRMSQHLGFNIKSNVLRRHLEGKNVDLEKCTFRLVALGPIFQEAATKEDHWKIRDRIAALEKALAESMREVGYEVINDVKCCKPLDATKFEAIRATLATHFPLLEDRQLGTER